MQFDMMARTYDTCGGLAVLSLVPEFLLADAPDFGTAIAELGITFHFSHSGPPRRSLTDLFANFQAYRQSLPKVVFRRKRAQAEIYIASDLIAGEDWRTASDVAPPLFKRAVVETIAALRLLGKRLTLKDDFDLPAFLAHCHETLIRLPSTQDELNAFIEDSKRRWTARQALISPWDKLAIDWRDFHPDARTILDDPFYWDCANDFAPHGNDTGADLLEDYRKWLRRDPSGDPVGFHARLVRRWGFSEGPSMESERALVDEAAVALAFAELKIRAACRPAAAVLAKTAIQRQRRQANEAADWPHRDERLRSLDLLEAKLSAVGFDTACAD
ncbi:MAG: hypothetical protein ABIW82_10875 [Dokdonella sp.]